MKTLHRLLQHNRSYRGIFVAIFAAFIGSFFAAPHAFAGGPIMMGQTYVGGPDRPSGTTYQDPRQLFSNNTQTRILTAFPGDTVSFYAHIQNWDPLPLPGNVEIQIHKVDFSGNDTLAPGGDSDKNTVQVGPSLGQWWYVGNNAFQQAPPWNEKVTSNTPGKQMCYYVQTNPTVYDYTNVVLFANPVIEGLHKFDVNPDQYHLSPGLFFDTVFLGIFNNISIGNPMSCVQVAYNYNLTPSISTNGGSSGPGGSVNVTTSVTQGQLTAGTSATVSQNTQWRISQFYLPTNVTAPPSTTVKLAQPSQQNPDPLCQYFSQKYNVQNCVIPKLSDGITPAASNGINTIFNADGSFKSGKSLPSALAAPANPPNGDTVCYVLSVANYSPYLPNDSWRNSQIVCGLVPKKPKVQILGDDVRVGKEIDTANMNATDPVTQAEKLFGSWGQYASYSVDATTNFATESGLKGGTVAGSQQASFSKLTFANAQSEFGDFSTTVASRGATGVASLFTANDQADTPIGSPQNLSNLNGKYLYNNPNIPLDIQGGTIGKGKTVIIVAPGGTVDIQGDITYASDGTPDTLSSIADIPQVIIIAKNILIDDNAQHTVQHIDAWLVADYETGTINTCDTITPATQGNLTSAICNQQLQINGPVVTNKLFLYRTFGSENNDPGAPAEIFNNNGISYLWAQNYLLNSNSLVTTNQTELPPRF